MPTSSYHLWPSGPTGLKGLSPLGHPALARNAPGQEKRLLNQAAMELEALFLGQLLQQLRRSLVETITPNPQASKSYQALADEHFARALAAGGGLTLAHNLVTQLSPKSNIQTRENLHGRIYPELNHTPLGHRDSALPGTP